MPLKKVSIFWSYPWEAAGFGSAELQSASLQLALSCCEAAKGAAAVLQDVW